MIDILQTDGDAPIARSLPDLWVGVVFELGKDPHCGFRRTYSFILPSHTQALPTLSNDIRKTPLLERSIPECRGRSRCLLCIAQSSFQQQSTPNVVFLTRGFYLGHFCTAFYAHIIPNISPFAHSKRRLQRGGLNRRQDGISTEAVGRAAQAGASVARSQLATLCADAAGVSRQHAFSAARQSPRQTMVVAKRRGRRADWRTRACCGPGVILTASVKGAREGARVKIMPVGRPQTAGRASRSGVGRTIGRRGDFQP